MRTLSGLAGELLALLRADGALADAGVCAEYDAEKIETPLKTPVVTVGISSAQAEGEAVYTKICRAHARVCVYEPAGAQESGIADAVIAALLRFAGGSPVSGVRAGARGFDRETGAMLREIGADIELSFLLSAPPALKFGAFSFPCNPAALRISCKNDIKELPRPFAGAVSQDYGKLCRAVSGEGVFSGENAFLFFIRLREACETGPALLTVPGFTPFYAFLGRLDYLGAAGRDFVRYGFEFVENPSMAYTKPSAPSQHIAAAGESVFGIAALYGLSAEYILSRNPALARLYGLSAGEVILL